MNKILCAVIAFLISPAMSMQINRDDISELGDTIDNDFSQVKGIKFDFYEKENGESVLYCNYNSKEFYNNYSKKITLEDIWNAINIYIENSLTSDTFPKNTKLIISKNSQIKRTFLLSDFMKILNIKNFLENFNKSIKDKSLAIQFDFKLVTEDYIKLYCKCDLKSDIQDVFDVINDLKNCVGTLLNIVLISFKYEHKTNFQFLRSIKITDIYSRKRIY